MIDDATLSAWIDGTLPDVEAARVAAAVMADPVLAGKADAHRRMRARLRFASGGIAEAPTPPQPGEPIAAPRSADIVDLAAVRAARARPAETKPPASRRWMAMAALMVAGVTGVYLLTDGPDLTNPEAGAAMAVTMPAAVARALETELAAAGPADGDVQVQLTFRDTRGAICRSFSAPDASGVACRANGGWALRALFPMPGGRGTAHRSAGGGDIAVASFVGTIIAGEPFDAATEARAKAARWQ